MLCFLWTVWKKRDAVATDTTTNEACEVGGTSQVAEETKRHEDGRKREPQRISDQSREVCHEKEPTTSIRDRGTHLAQSLYCRLRSPAKTANGDRGRGQEDKEQGKKTSLKEECSSPDCTGKHPVNFHSMIDTDEQMVKALNTREASRKGCTVVTLCNPRAGNLAALHPSRSNHGQAG